MGYCLFPVLGRDTADGVAIVGAMACTTGAPTCRTEGLCARARAWEGLSRQASLGALSRQRWLTLCRNRDFSVETGSWVVTAFGVATQFWCRDKGAELLGWFVSRHNFYVVTVGRGQERQKSSVATDFSVFSIEVSLSRQSLPVWCRDTALWCCDRVGWLSDVTTEHARSSALNSARSVLALCTR